MRVELNQKRVELSQNELSKKELSNVAPALLCLQKNKHLNENYLQFLRIVCFVFICFESNGGHLNFISQCGHWNGIFPSWQT